MHSSNMNQREEKCFHYLLLTKWCASNQMLQEKAENSPEVYDYIGTVIATNEDEKTQHITAPKFSPVITDSESLPERCAKGKERVNRQSGER